MSTEDRALRGAGTGTGERSLRIDALRGIAAFMVLVAHSELLTGVSRTNTDGTLGGSLTDVSSAGIFLFFAISGYLIAGPFLRALADGRPLPSVRGYLVRRAARILPPYWVGLLVILLVIPQPLATPKTVALHAVLLQNLIPGAGATAIYFVAWTLGIEALFYLVVPLAAGLIARLHGGRPVPLGRLAAIVIAAWLASIAVSVLSAWALPTPGYWSGPLRIGLPAMFGQFCPGMLLVLALHADARRREGPLLRTYRAIASRPLPVFAAVVALVVVGELVEQNATPWLGDPHRALFAVAAGLVLILAVNGGRWTDRVARILAPLGTISYGVYLWHWVVVVFVGHHHLQPGLGAGAKPWIKNIVLVAAITIVIAGASWLIVERPLIRRAARFAQARFRSASGVGAGAAADAAAAAATGSTEGTAAATNVA